MQFLLDQQLRNKVKEIIDDKSDYEISSIKELLQKGANPGIELDSSEPTAYEMVKQNNKNGEYNALIEEFDHFMQYDLRESDSVEEGMPVTDEENS